MHTPGFRLASSSALAASQSARKTCRTSWALRRHVHTRRELPYKIEDGLGHFMSPQTLRMVAVEYQQGLLDRLNEECRSKHLSRTSTRLLLNAEPRRRGQTQVSRAARARHGSVARQSRHVQIRQPRPQQQLLPQLLGRPHSQRPYFRPLTIF